MCVQADTMYTKKHCMPCTSAQEQLNNICMYVVMSPYNTVYTLTFAGLNFRGLQILAIFAFLLSRMQSLSL